MSRAAAERHPAQTVDDMAKLARFAMTPLVLRVIEQ
jgi:hypothetical protein